MLNKQQPMSVDLKYTVNISTPSKYQLVCSLSPENEDDTRLYKEYIEFCALPGIELPYQKQTLDEISFAKTLVSNVTCEPQADVMVNVLFDCMGLFKSYNLSIAESIPHDAKTILFQIQMADATSLTNLHALSVGSIQCQWNSGSRNGIFHRDVIQRQVSCVITNCARIMSMMFVFSCNFLFETIFSHDFARNHHKYLMIYRY